MSTSPVLKVERLCLSRGGRRLAAPVQLQLDVGERGLLTGGNGSGKTTLMDTLCGLLPVQEGRVDHVGRIGYAPQEPRFPDHLTCVDYLSQLFRLGGGPRGPCKQAVGLVLAQFQLEKYRRNAIGSLSRGWRQRMNLARAWLGAPELLLLDEPQTALDPEGMEALEDAILKASSSAVLMVAPKGVGCDRLAPLLGTLEAAEVPCSP